jgi:hypothetical protein
MIRGMEDVATSGVMSQREGKGMIVSKGVIIIIIMAVIMVGILDQGKAVTIAREEGILTTIDELKRVIIVFNVTVTTIILCIPDIPAEWWMNQDMHCVTAMGLLWQDRRQERHIPASVSGHVSSLCQVQCVLPDIVGIGRVDKVIMVVTAEQERTTEVTLNPSVILVMEGSITRYDIAFTTEMRLPSSSNNNGRNTKKHRKGAF